MIEHIDGAAHFELPCLGTTRRELGRAIPVPASYRCARRRRTAARALNQVIHIRAATRKNEAIGRPTNR